MWKKSAYLVITTMLILASCATAKKVAVEDHSTSNDDQRVIYESKYPEQFKPQFYFTEGIKQAKLFGNTELAISLFNKVIELDSTHAPSYFHAASALTFSDPAKALEYSRKANELDSSELWYKSQLGRLYIINGDYSKAKNIYEELVGLSPKDPENYSMLAALYQYSNQPYTAIAILDKAEEVLGKQEQLVSYKREMLIKMKLYDRAINETKDLINDHPYNYENYLALAELYATTRKDSLAIKNYNAALRLNPDAVDVLISLNDYFKATGDNVNHFITTRQLMKSDDITLDSKINYYKDLMFDLDYYRDNFYRIRDLVSILLEKYPDDYEVLQIAATNMLASGDANEAVELYKNKISDTLSDKRIYTAIIELETYLERKDSVDKYMGMALKQFPQDAELYLRYGGILTFIEGGKWTDQSMEVFEKAYKYAENDSVRSSIMGMMGDIYQSQANVKKSFKSYRKALDLKPDNIVVLNNYAYYLSELDQDTERALEMSSKVVELEPGNATYIDTYGWILYKLGRYEEAKKAMMQAVALDSSNSKELFLHYGDILYALGENYMATFYWNRALKAGYDEEIIKERLKKVENK